MAVYFYNCTVSPFLRMQVTNGDGNVIWKFEYPSFYEDRITGDLIEDDNPMQLGIMKDTKDLHGLCQQLKMEGLLGGDDTLSAYEYGQPQISDEIIVAKDGGALSDSGKQQWMMTFDELFNIDINHHGPGKYILNYKEDGLGVRKYADKPYSYKYPSTESAMIQGKKVQKELFLKALQDRGVENALKTGNITFADVEKIAKYHKVKLPDNIFKFSSVKMKSGGDISVLNSLLENGIPKLKYEKPSDIDWQNTSQAIFLDDFLNNGFKRMGGAQIEPRVKPNKNSRFTYSGKHNVLLESENFYGLLITYKNDEVQLYIYDGGRNGKIIVYTKEQLKDAIEKLGYGELKL